MTDENKRRTADIENYRININGHGVHYLKAGSGPPVLLLHGGASDSRDWLGTISALAGGYSLYAPDLIGFGQSDRREEGYYLSDFSDFIVEFMKTQKLGNASLVGHSFGARVCLEVALRRPELVRKLVLIDAAGLGNVTRFGTALLTGFWGLRRLFNRPQPYPKFLAREGDDYNPLNEDKLPGIKMPTLLVWKRLDPYVPVSIARRAAELIPDSRLVVISGYGHAPHQVNAKEFNKVLLEFLNGD